MRHRFNLWPVGLALLAIAGTTAIALNHSVEWRAAVLFEKATGQIGDIAWPDLLWMLRPHSDISLEQLAEVRNPYKVIKNPLHSPSDRDKGAGLYRDHCGSCHGIDAHGGPGGPSLRDREFRQGHADWALYRTITLGVPGTAMIGHRLPSDDVWRLVTYLDSVLGLQQASLGEAKTSGPKIEPVSASDLRGAGEHSAEWLMYSGSYSGQRHSQLEQINRSNVRYLRVDWQRQFPMTEERLETSPIVRGSTMFVTESPDRVHALDAATGRVLWTYARDLPEHLLLCCGTVNRGVALLDNLVFVSTLDAHLVALDASTGKVVWDVAVADASSGYSITSAPLVVDDMVVTGIAGGEFSARGFIDAYDARTGKRRWRFYTVPTPGEPGSETWSGDALRRGGGGPTWLTGSFDPELRLIYWGVGNPAPNYYGGNRKGDNLYTDSVVAIDADSGKLRWYFQFTPHDLHDRDAAQIPVLVDAAINGYGRKLLASANRNGFYYLLDRVTGKFLLGVPFVRQNWTDGLDESGRPHVRPESNPSLQGAFVYPSIIGGTNWWPPSYDPELQLFFVPTIDRGGMFYESSTRLVDDDGLTRGGSAEIPHADDAVAAVKALELSTGHVRWQYEPPPGNSHFEMGGLLSTAGKLVFGGEGESFFAVDAETGKELWHFETGGHIVAAPVTYQLAGRQYVAIAAGRAIIAFDLPASKIQSGAATTSH